MRVPWTARRSNRSILKEISPEYSLEGLMLKLKFQYFGHLMRRTDALEKPVMLGKIEGRRRRGRQSMRWLDGIMASPTLVMDRQNIMAHFRNPAMPSVAATSDAAMKIASVRQAFAQTDTFLEMIGFSQADIRRIKSQERMNQGLQVLTELEE